mmetsp:Transcript_85531/g.190074  ORF Transcript_85531/g.190074 Transcript_85531/m.190074 type:complete len:327 (+) Transcript_85531:81-1061(+)
MTSALGAPAMTSTPTDPHCWTSAQSQQTVPSHGPYVQVRNTFLDVDMRSPDPAELRRSRTAPPDIGRLNTAMWDRRSSTWDQAGSTRSPLGGALPLQQTPPCSRLVRQLSNPVISDQALTPSAPDPSKVPPVCPVLVAKMATVDPAVVKVAPAAAASPRQPQTLRLSWDSDDFQIAYWVADARKLRGNDQQMVSPPFQLRLGTGSRPTAPFKLMICPKRGAISKGGACFKSMRGRGIVKLKCEGDVPEATADVSFSISIGPSAHGQMLPKRGPAVHNFARSAVCGLPKELEEWDFGSVVDEGSLTFVVRLEARNNQRRLSAAGIAP